MVPLFAHLPPDSQMLFRQRPCWNCNARSWEELEGGYWAQDERNEGRLGPGRRLCPLPASGAARPPWGAATAVLAAETLWGRSVVNLLSSALHGVSGTSQRLQPRSRSN